MYASGERMGCEAGGTGAGAGVKMPESGGRVGDFLGLGDGDGAG